MVAELDDAFAPDEVQTQLPAPVPDIPEITAMQRLEALARGSEAAVTALSRIHGHSDPAAVAVLLREAGIPPRLVECLCGQPPIPALPHSKPGVKQVIRLNMSVPDPKDAVTPLPLEAPLPANGKKVPSIEELFPDLGTKYAEYEGLSQLADRMTEALDAYDSLDDRWKKIGSTTMNAALCDLPKGNPVQHWLYCAKAKTDPKGQEGGTCEGVPGTQPKPKKMGQTRVYYVLPGQANKYRAYHTPRFHCLRWNPMVLRAIWEDFVVWYNEWQDISPVKEDVVLPEQVENALKDKQKKSRYFVEEFVDGHIENGTKVPWNVPAMRAGILNSNGTPMLKGQTRPVGYDGKMPRKPRKKV